MRRFALVFVLPLLLAGACKQPTPNAPADPNAVPPKWGQGFDKPATTTDTNALLAGAPKTAGSASGDVGNNDAAGTSGNAATGSNTGNADAGKTVWMNQCAKCHGGNGQGIGIMGTPALVNPEWQARMTDAQIVTVIQTGKKKMPAFGQQLSQQEINDVVAFIRTLKK